MSVNPELGAYRSHYTRFEHAQALFFFMHCPGYKSTSQTFTDYFTQNFSTYTRVYTVIEIVDEWPHIGHIISSRCDDSADILIGETV